MTYCICSRSCQVNESVCMTSAILSLCDWGCYLFVMCALRVGDDMRRQGRSPQRSSPAAAVATQQQETRAMTSPSAASSTLSEHESDMWVYYVIINVLLVFVEFCHDAQFSQIYKPTVSLPWSFTVGCCYLLGITRWMPVRTSLLWGPHSRGLPCMTRVVTQLSNLILDLWLAISSQLCKLNHIREVMNLSCHPGLKLPWVTCFQNI